MSGFWCLFPIYLNDHLLSRCCFDLIFLSVKSEKVLLAPCWSRLDVRLPVRIYCRMFWQTAARLTWNCPSLQFKTAKSTLLYDHTEEMSAINESAKLKYSANVHTRKINIGEMFYFPYNICLGTTNKGKEDEPGRLCWLNLFIRFLSKCNWKTNKENF